MSLCVPSGIFHTGWMRKQTKSDNHYHSIFHTSEYGYMVFRSWWNFQKCRNGIYDTNTKFMTEYRERNHLNGEQKKKTNEGKQFFVSDVRLFSLTNEESGIMNIHTITKTMSKLSSFFHLLLHEVPDGFHSFCSYEYVFAIIYYFSYMYNVVPHPPTTAKFTLQSRHIDNFSLDFASFLFPEFLQFNKHLLRCNLVSFQTVAVRLVGSTPNTTIQFTRSFYHCHPFLFLLLCFFLCFFSFLLVDPLFVCTHTNHATQLQHYSIKKISFLSHFPSCLYVRQALEITIIYKKWAGKWLHGERKKIL